MLHNADHCLTYAIIIALFLLAVPLASCFVRWVRLRFVLHNADHCLTRAVIIALSLLAVPLASWLEGRLRTALLLLAPRNAGAPIKGGEEGA